MADDCGGLYAKPKVEITEDVPWQMVLIARWAAGSAFITSPVSLRLVNLGSVGVVFPQSKPKGWLFSHGVEAVLGTNNISVAISGPLDPSHHSKRYRLPVALGSTRLDLCHEDKDYLMQCLKNLENTGAKLVDISPLGPVKKRLSEGGPNPRSSPSYGRSLICSTVMNGTPQVVKSVASQSFSLKRPAPIAQTSPVIRRRNMSQPQPSINGLLSSSVFAPRHPPVNFSLKPPIAIARPTSFTPQLQHANDRKHQATVYEDENKARFIIVQEMTMRDGVWHRATPVGQLREVGCSANEILNRACGQLSSVQYGQPDDPSRTAIANRSKKYTPMIYEDLNNKRFTIIEELQLQHGVWNLPLKPYGQMRLVAMSSDEILSRACAEMTNV